jgi:hypothetical protein
MQQLPTHVQQSFWLRFWRVSIQAEPQQWRGEIWHEQQEADETFKPVIGPEEAFEVIRRTLDLPSGLNTPKVPLDGNPQQVTRGHRLTEKLRSRVVARSHFLQALKRKFRRSES